MFSTIGRLATASLETGGGIAASLNRGRNDSQEEHREANGKNENLNNFMHMRSITPHVTSFRSSYSLYSLLSADLEQPFFRLAKEPVSAAACGRHHSQEEYGEASFCSWTGMAEGAGCCLADLRLLGCPIPDRELRCINLAETRRNRQAPGRTSDGNLLRQARFVSNLVSRGGPVLPRRLGSDSF